MCTWSTPAAAQEEVDSTGLDTVRIYRFTEAEYFHDSLIDRISLKIDNIHRYETTPHGYPLLFTGNMGHAGYSPIYSMQGLTSIHKSINQGFDPYLLHRENINYYQTDIPYTSLSYLTGSKREEAVRVVHSRNFGKKLNVGVKLDKTGSQGFYLNQNLRTTFFDFSTNFKSRDNRYGFLANYYYNKIDANENGGYPDTQTLPETGELDDPQLTNGTTSLREQGLMLKQYFDLGKTTVDSDDYKTFEPRVRIGYEVAYLDAYRQFKDLRPDSNFYDHIYYDSLETNDSVYTRNFNHAISLGFLLAGNELKVQYKQELFTLGLPLFERLEMENNMAGAAYTFTMNKALASVSADYVLSGFNQDDLYVKGQWKWKRMTADSLPAQWTVRFNFLRETPNAYLQQYYSNHFIWNNHFTKQIKYGVSADYLWKSFRFNGGWDHIEQYVYFNESALPEQHAPALNIYYAGVQHRVNWGRFTLDNRIHYQYVSDRELIPLPSMVFNESIFYSNALIKKVLEYQLGFDIFYYTANNTYAYQPALSQFHLQASPATKLGNYPYIDLFLNLKLKRAFFMIKMAHINQGWTGSGYYQVPGYPVPPSAFKFGIRWILFD